jgi:tRNA-specific 2-thiouridylase
VESLIEEYLADTSRSSEPEPESFSGAAGGSACGDLVRISLRADAGVISDVTFGAEGCAAARAAAAYVCEAVDGAGVLDASRIGPEEVSDGLGGLGPQGFHAAVLAADALHRAISALAGSGAELAAADPNRIAVAVSGGVDSAVAALEEREKGREVVAVTVKLWADSRTDGTKACCSPEAVLGARALMHSLGVPHFTLDLEDEFRRRVVSGFIEGYESGRTPNPCVLCNGSVRIGRMVEFAGQVGAASLATGHYAGIVDDGEGPLLREGDDPRKDQSYMLSGLDPALLDRLEFPLAGTSKSQVRQKAIDHSLMVARKPESQDLCFLAGSDKDSFLRDHAGIRGAPGPITDSEGNLVGSHQGHHRYTVGQRRGLGLAAGRPLYVTRKDAETNTVVVGSHEELETDRVEISDVVLHRDGSRVDRVRLRYGSPAMPASVAGGAGRHERLEIHLGEPFAGAAPGQAAVLMSGRTVVGHGTIE